MKREREREGEREEIDIEDKYHKRNVLFNVHRIHLQIIIIRNEQHRPHTP